MPHSSSPLCALALTLSLPFLLCLTHCSSAEEISPEADTDTLGSVQQAAVPYLYCTSTPTCVSVANLPFCADTSSFCNLHFHECMYRIKNDVNCPCIERDVRACTLPGGGSGIQNCVVDSPKTHTWWNDCHAC